jgi:hypothetical protein
MIRLGAYLVDNPARRTPLCSFLTTNRDAAAPPYAARVTTIPHTTPGLWPDNVPPARLASHVLQTFATGCRVAILGLPDDLGVRLNNGRPGAAFLMRETSFRPRAPTRRRLNKRTNE